MQAGPGAGHKKKLVSLGTIKLFSLSCTHFQTASLAQFSRDRRQLKQTPESPRRHFSGKAGRSAAEKLPRVPHPAASLGTEKLTAPNRAKQTALLPINRSCCCSHGRRHGGRAAPPPHSSLTAPKLLSQPGSNRSYKLYKNP